MGVLRWARKRPELVILGVFALVVAAGIVRYQLRTRPMAQPDSSASPSVAAVVDSVTPVPDSPSSSPSAVPSVVVSDNPAFDLTGSGDACRMTYFQDGQGRTVTLFTLTADGELITHVSGPPGIGRHDEQMTRGVSRIVYDFPLSQATDMGAVLYLPDGTQQSCSITPGS